MADLRRRRRTRLWHGRIVLAVVVCVLAAGGGVAWAMTGSNGPTYRTATATVTSITETLNSVGTIQAVDKAVVTFPVAGHVASVAAVLGQPVISGEVLATLDTTSLDQAENQAKQTVAADQQKLANDQSGQTSTGTGTSSGTGSGTGAGTGSGSGSGLGTNSAGQAPLTTGSAPASASPTRQSGGSSAPSAGSGGSSASVAEVTAAQQRLMLDQHALDAVLTDQSLTDLRALVAASGPCAMTPATATTFAATSDASGKITVTTPQPAILTAGAAAISPPQQGAGGYTYTITGTPSTAYTVSVTPSTGSIDATACTAAIQKLVGALDASPSDNAWIDAQAVNSDEFTLAGAISKLEKAGGASGAARSTTASGAGSAQRSTAASTAASSASSGASSRTSSSSTPTPEQIAADQAAVDAAQAELAVASQNRDQATIRTPISGTVAAVGLTVGSSAGTNSVTVIGPGAHEVTTTVSLADVDLVKVGDTARLSVDGIRTPITGHVTSIGVLNSTTGSSTTFPVSVLLDDTAARLFDGAGAAVSIVVTTVPNALSVPSSAVHSAGVLHTVDLLAGGKVTTTRVAVGAVGIDRTQITSGLIAGQRVVLAQLNAPLPTGTTTGRGLGGAGLGGGVLGGTGLGGTGLNGRTRVGG